VVGVLLLAGNSSTLPMIMWQDLTLTTGSCVANVPGPAGYRGATVSGVRRGGPVRLRRVAVNVGGAQVSLCNLLTVCLLYV